MTLFAADAGAPIILSHPQSAGIEEGDSARFETLVQSPGSTTYQWFHEGEPVLGATAFRLTVADADESDAGAYFCRVTGPCASRDTAPATLAVAGRCLGDTDRNGLIDFLDFNEVLGFFGQSCNPPAD